MSGFASAGPSIDPGPRRRGEAFAAEGRAAMVVALGLILVLLVSGVIEAFVTPSGLPTWARIAIGVCAWSAFVAWIAVLGRRAARAGVTGDLDEELRERCCPASAEPQSRPAAFSAR